MDQSERQKRIVEYLRIKPVNHGQVHTFQIAVPNLESVEISPERFELLAGSLTQQNTNLIPVVVRRTENYSEEEDYEVVHGADWCIVARELGVEKLWVWVFDMTDDEANIFRKEIENLVGQVSSNPSPDSFKQTELLLKRFENSIEKRISRKIDDVVKIIEEERVFEKQKIEARFQSFEKQLSKKNDPLTEINALDEEALSLKLTRVKIPTPEKFAKDICKIRDTKPQNQFVDYQDVVKSVKGLAEKRMLSIIDGWS